MWCHEIRRTRAELIATVALATFAAWALLIATSTPVMSEPQHVRIDGRVQWISAEKMLLLPSAGIVPVNVDLRQVPQDQYAALTRGTRVVVDGAVSNDGRWLVASTVLPSDAYQERVDAQEVMLRPR
jgi:hypothetical protein